MTDVSWAAGVVSNISQCQITLTKSCAQVFIYLIFISSVTVRVMIKVTVRVLGLGLGLVVGLAFGLIILTSYKSHTASYLAMRHIWHDTGSNYQPATLTHYIVISAVLVTRSDTT